jgi:hypothetical protein
MPSKIRRRVSINRGFFHPVLLTWGIRSPIQFCQEGHFTAAPPTGLTKSAQDRGVFFKSMVDSASWQIRRNMPNSIPSRTAHARTDRSVQQAFRKPQPFQYVLMVQYG